MKELRERAEAWKVTIGLQANYKTSTPQVRDKLHTEDPNIQKLILAVDEKELSVKEILDTLC